MHAAFVNVRISAPLDRLARAATLGAALATASASLLGCASGASDTSAPKTAPASKSSSEPRIATGIVGAGIALRDARVEAFPGRTLFVPIGPVDAEGSPALTMPPGWRPSGEPEVALVTDEPVRSVLWRLRGRPWTSPPDLDPWLPPPFGWTAETWDKATTATEPGEIVLWFLAIDMPDRPVGRWLRIGGRKLPLEWVETPTDLRTKGNAAFAAMSPDRIAAVGRLSHRFASDAHDAFRAWRIALLGERFPALLYQVLGEPPLPEIEFQMRDRAFAAIARIRAVDRALGDRVIAVMTAVVETPDGALLPAWPPDPTPALELIGAVLRESRTEADIRADALAYLRTAPPAIAWIVDEAGPDGPSGAPTCTVAIADRSGEQSIASLAPLGMHATNATPLAPFGSALLTVDPAFPGDITTTTLTARAGVWSSEISVLAGWVGARPPGVTLGPLLPDWNHATWVRGAPPRIDPNWITMAMLQRQIDAEGVPQGWEMLIEAQRPETAGDGDDDAVTIWIGPMGSTAAAIRISADGEAAIIAGPLTGELLPVNINAAPDRWIAQVTLPPELTATPRLRIALERIDPRGVRSAWPRPMLPDQLEPGRLAVDLNSW